MLRLTFVIFALICACTSPAMAAVPGQISLQGKLTDSAGVALSDGSYPVTFRIYSFAGPGGTALWSEVSQVTTVGGLFTTNLGSVTPIPSALFDVPTRWLGIQVQGFDEMTPRTQLTSAAYAHNSADWTSTGEHLTRMSGNVGIGISSPQARLHVGGGLRWGGQTATPSARSDIDASGLFIEHVGSTSANEKIRFQTSEGGLLTSYAQFIIDPSNGFSFATLGAGNGNVGIGTLTPASKLEVRGDIRLGPSGQYHAPAGEENLRMIRGVVGSNGAIIAGSGFTVSHTPGSGTYFIDFNTAFPTAPAVTAMPFAASAMLAVAGDVVGSSAEIKIYDPQSTTTPVDGTFHFTVIGPR